MFANRVGSAFFLFFTLCCITSALAEDYDPRDVVNAAEDFVSLIDYGLFAESWEEGDPLLQIRTPREEWIGRLALERDLFGWVLHRSPRVSTYRDSLPGLPDGDYVIVVFDSVFERKRAAVETLIMVLDAEGGWKSVGYSLK